MKGRAGVRDGSSRQAPMTRQTRQFWVLNWENWETLKPQKNEEAKQVGPGKKGGSFLLTTQFSAFQPTLTNTVNVPGAGASPCWSLLQRKSGFTSKVVMMKKKDLGSQEANSPLYTISLNALPQRKWNRNLTLLKSSLPNQKRCYLTSECTENQLRKHNIILSTGKRESKFLA